MYKGAGCSSGSTPNSGRSSVSNNNEQAFPPLNYSRSYFTQWLLKDTEDCTLWKELPSPTQKKNSHTSGSGPPSRNLKRNNMELIQLLAINALEFTAPVYSFLNKDCNKPSPKEEKGKVSEESRKQIVASTSSSNSNLSSKPLAKTLSTNSELNKELALNREFIQLSGHPGSFAPAGPNTIWKKMPNDSDNEANVYERLRDTADDPFKTLIPSYISRTEWNGSIFIELEDLVTRFDINNLNIMDIKLGTRTFLESEVSNTKPRSDLYDKMFKLDSEAFSDEEKASKTVTKLRYMLFREELSSTKLLGFRIEGIKLSKGRDKEFKSLNFARLRDESTIRDILTSVCGDLRRKFFNRLVEFSECLENSRFFMSHEIIGSSLLLIHDESTFGVWIIDFAKSFEVANVSHRNAWRMGNREDGVLTGIDNVIRLLKPSVRE